MLPNPPLPPVDSSTTPLAGPGEAEQWSGCAEKSPAQAVVLYRGALWEPILRGRENLCPSLVARLAQRGLVLGATDAQSLRALSVQHLLAELLEHLSFCAEIFRVSALP